VVKNAARVKIVGRSTDHPWRSRCSARSSRHLLLVGVEATPLWLLLIGALYGAGALQLRVRDLQRMQRFADLAKVHIVTICADGRRVRRVLLHRQARRNPRLCGITIARPSCRCARSDVAVNSPIAAAVAFLRVFVGEYAGLDPHLSAAQHGDPQYY
jgi:hypothetical protein